MYARASFSPDLLYSETPGSREPGVVLMKWNVLLIRAYGNRSRYAGCRALCAGRAGCAYTTAGATATVTVVFTTAAAGTTAAAVATVTTCTTDAGCSRYLYVMYIVYEVAGYINHHVAVGTYAIATLATLS